MPFSPMQGGVLVVDKPAGPTSFAVVERVRRAARAAKAGHTGTLDPAATRVLALCLEHAVKLQHWITEGDKAYEALVVLGVATDTEDAEGRVVARGDASGVDADRVAAVLPGLLGESEQLPPMYSAVRVGGRRLHEAARAGEEVVRTPRRVIVHALDLLAFDPPEGGVARARIAVRCGKGTYVRTLATAIGAALGVPAHLGALRRTASGPFTLAGALALEEVEALGRTDPAGLRARLVSPADALAGMPSLTVDDDQIRALAQGRFLPVTAPGEPCKAVDGQGRLVAVCAVSGGRLRPVRVFLTPAEL